VVARVLRQKSPGLRFAVTLIFGAFAATAVQAGVNRWTPVGPGPGVFAWAVLTIDRTHPSIIYAIASTGFRAGIFKSSNGGDTWAEMDSGLTSASVRALAIDPIVTTTLYASTDFRGVFKTTDGGTT
jgi:photosystem II stability/assembly factor-like uncharacterized protein